MSFQSRLKCARKKKRFTMEQIAKMIGVAKSTYASYELGYREPNIATIRMLSQALDISVDYLLGISDSPHIQSADINAKTLLQNKNIHWDGVKLEEEELKSILEFLEYKVNNKAVIQSQDSKVKNCDKKMDGV